MHCRYSFLLMVPGMVRELWPSRWNTSTGAAETFRIYSSLSSGVYLCNLPVCSPRSFDHVVEKHTLSLSVSITTGTYNGHLIESNYFRWVICTWATWWALKSAWNHLTLNKVYYLLPLIHTPIPQSRNYGAILADISQYQLWRDSSSTV